MRVGAVVSVLARLRDWLRKPETAPAAAPLPIPVEPVGDPPNWPAILRAAGFVNPSTWAVSIAPAAQRRGIHAGRRAAAFAATIAHESAGGTRLVESMNYDPAGLMKTWPSRFTQDAANSLGRRNGMAARQEAIAETVYGGRMGNGPRGSGDGWRYRGRGLIQITGRDAYSTAADALNLPLVSRPEIAAEPGAAAEIAAWTWGAWKGCNSLADAGDVESWRRRINGGHIGLDDCRARYRAVMEAMRWT